ncbi:enoyl-CoA hydratase/isomerase family protein [Chelativorans sp. AA-79]|uniref:enoyl-CoA hydratase/isomerase family protein n=1 Tax=Chelativorans sp. AA-79 TaxID=3028735 RepID=UPI0023F67A4D|nr:enoyl-CoA hydratase/isomerase family protein [Chelativorans sp. AA-79]WEX09037.1 enoyl-CoA hydratase/isomerase family protein [Chelativorans sp. AA-79]
MTLPRLETVKATIEDGIAVVTCDRPPVNAQNRRMREEFIALFDALSDLDEVRVVVLTAAGKYFSAGADIKERADFEETPGYYIGHNRLTREFFYAVSDCSKPVIAAVNGPAFGAGFALMLACDIMFAVEDAYFVMPEIDVGLAGGLKFVADHFGKSRTNAMYLTGRRYPAAELYRLGIIEAALPAEEMWREVMKMAREIASKSPVAVRKIKRAMQVIEEMPTREAYRYEQTVTVDLSHTEDAREAQRAFVEKRQPQFKGR